MQKLSKSDQPKRPKMQQQQAEFQKKQFKMQADAAEIETVQAENDRKKKYLTKLNENRALFSKMNITTDSASYRAFLKANKEAVHYKLKSKHEVALDVMDQLKSMFDES